MREHIFPETGFLSRTVKEKMLKQKGRVIWLTGLSGSGKTSIAVELEKQLHARGLLTQVLDGDNIRAGLNTDLGFSADDRRENVRRIAEVCLLFVQCGVIVICPLVSPSNQLREMARSIIGNGDFMEVYLNASLEVCEARDVKGLYAAARSGTISNFTGLGSSYEIPLKPDLIVDSGTSEISDCVKEILKRL